MTVYNHLQSGFIDFGDQATGTSGPDQITLDTTGTNSNPTGATTIDGADGNDKIFVSGPLEAGMESATIDGGIGTDSLSINATDISAAGHGLTVDAFSGSFTIGSISATHIEALV